MRFKVTYFRNTVKPKPTDKSVFMEVENMNDLRRRVAASSAFKPKWSAYIEIVLEQTPFEIALMTRSSDLEDTFFWWTYRQGKLNGSSRYVIPETGKLIGRYYRCRTS